MLDATRPRTAFVAALLSLGAIACAMSATLGPSAQVVHIERSLYRNIYVYDASGARCMTFSRSRYAGRQACVWLARPDALVFDYTRAMLAATAIRPGPSKILAIGLGGGTLPRALASAYPEAHIDVVEVDPAVIRVAQQFFGLVTGPRLQVHAEDGRVFVRHALAMKAMYDIVLLDAFDHEYVPEHLLTREFFAQIRDLLRPDGLLVANTFSAGRLYHHESATYAAVFGSFYNVLAGNRLIVTQLGGLPSIEVLSQRVRAATSSLRAAEVDPELFIASVRPATDWDRTARVLTDNYSPSNILNRQ